VAFSVIKNTLLPKRKEPRRLVRQGSFCFLLYITYIHTSTAPLRLSEL